MPEWFNISPHVATPSAAKQLLQRVRALMQEDVGGAAATHVAKPRARSRRATGKTVRIKPQDRVAIDTVIVVLRDLMRQGWALRVKHGHVELAAPAQLADRAAEKSRVQQQLLVERDEQLRELPVRDFVASMERRRLHNGKFVSIFSLMRDGTSLAETLNKAAAIADETSRAEQLRDCVKPYLQEVREGELCPETGFRLVDIWRYFRHTWSKAYRSVPGRTLMLLVRDAAAPFNPIIGIAAVSSPMVQIAVRDRWIGWHPETFINRVQEMPTAAWLDWLKRTLDTVQGDVYVDDLIADELLTHRHLTEPDEKCIARLEKEAAKRRKEHHRFVETGDHRQEDSGEDDSIWAGRAVTDLFRSKRAKLLSEILRARRSVAEACSGRTPQDAIQRLLDTPEGLQALTFAARRTKAARVGIAIADLNVCGAVAPYNEILGGKLVAMLMASPEVGQFYRSRYESARSIIASSMAGRGLVKAPELVLLGTTSLYGTGSSQYNRLRLPAVGSDRGSIEYLELGVTEGFGTLQFSAPTLDAIAALVAQREDGQRVNSIFGEGVNPRFRKVRDGLDYLGLPSDILLRHGAPRVVYGIPLARNFREFLFGLTETPDYLLPQTEPRRGTEMIIDWWRARWLARRVMRDDVRSRVAGHRLSLPVRHGARVPLPPLSPDNDEFEMPTSSVRLA